MAKKPSLGDVISVLQEVKEKLEIEHCVRIQDEALIIAARLAIIHFEGTKLQEKSVELVKEACVRLRHTIETKAEENELDMMEYTLHRSRVEYNELKKEKDEASKAWLVQVDKELEDALDKVDSFRRKWKPLLMSCQRSEERGGEIYILHQVHQWLVSSLEKAEMAMDNAPLSEVFQVIGAVLGELEQNTHEYFKQNVTVGPDQIAEVASQLTGIPALYLHINPKNRLTGLGERLHKRVVGQDQAIDAVTKALLRPKIGMIWSKRPIGSFLFVGSNGVGKAELSRSLAEQIFSDENLLIRIDMSDYMEPHSLSRLIGAFPGTDDYEVYGAGQLTEAVRRRPYSVVLFDKIEKAHFSIIEILSDILMDGSLSDGEGYRVDFTNTLIIMTSNVGTTCRCHLENSQIQLIITEGGRPTGLTWINCSAGHTYMRQDSGRDRVLQEVRRQFNHELLKLLDDVIVFAGCNIGQLKDIARLQLRDMATTLAKRGVTLYTSDAALSIIANWASVQFGLSGRAVNRCLEETLFMVLSEMLAEDKVDQNPTVYIDSLVGTDELSFSLEKSRVLVDDQVFKQFKEPIGDLRIMYRKEKERINQIYRLRRAHYALITSERNAGAMIDLVHDTRVVQELVNMIDAVKNTIDVELIFDESLVVASCLNEVAELIKRKRDKERVQGLGIRLRERMVGQHQAIDIVTEAVLRSIDAPLDLPHQPAGSFLFLGLSGVGKAELVKGLDEQLFTDDGMHLLIQINLSEYTDPHSLPRLLGSPLGHECGLPLPEAVRGRPYSVLLFDQVEEAHLSVFSTLLWMLDHGKLADSQGRTVDFRNTIIIMVSDLGNKKFLAKLFGHSSPWSIGDRIIQQGGRHFRSELLNRVDEIVFFNTFLLEQLGKVARLPMMADHHLQEREVSHLFDEDYKSKFGNRYFLMLCKAVRNLSKRFLKNGTSCKK